MIEDPYLFVFILLLLGGIGVPMPEEIPLIYGGIFAVREEVNLWMMLGVCYVGVLIGDQLMYAFGYWFGNRVLDKSTRSPLFPFITEEKVQEVREGLRKRRLMYLFVGRHLFFLRTVTFIVAGALRIPFREFLASDALAALVSVTIFVFLGYGLGSSISPEWVSYVTHRANIVVFCLLVVGGVVYQLLRARKRKREAEATPPEAVLANSAQDERSVPRVGQ